MRTASHDIRAAAGRLREERLTIGRAFGQVVGGDWEGAAAVSFREVFDDWDAGMTDVEGGLAARTQTAIRRALDQAGIPRRLSGAARISPRRDPRPSPPR